MSPAARFHLISAVAWVPITAVIFLLNLENAVWVLLIISIYANMKTDWGAFHAAAASAKARREQAHAKAR